MSSRIHAISQRLFAPLFLLILPFAAHAEQHSDLWGAHGERWNTHGRLPDFSHAGYQQGEKSLPVLPQTNSVKNFGAVGDGVTDDTQAFKDAIAATNSGAIFVPPGRYKITDAIYIKKSGVVLRGDGPDKSILWFPIPLNEIKPRVSKTSSGKPTVAYSFDFGFLNLQGSNPSKTSLATITEHAKRGDSVVRVASPEHLSVGQKVTIRVREDSDQSLKKALYAQDPGNISKGKNLDTRMVVTITAIKDKEVHFNRPLRFETQASWQPEILSFEPTVTESGIEDLGLEFPETKYRGHFEELGFNGIELRSVVNSWVKNVRLHNSDMGVLLAGDSTFNTIDGVVISAYGGRGQLTGHHGIQAKRVQDNLITRFDMQTRFVHDLSVENTSGNVFSNGKGVDLCLDHHSDTPYANLFTDMDCGACKRLWYSGGGEGIGKHSAAWATFWNIRSPSEIELPSSSYWPDLVNLVALNVDAKTVKTSTGKWIERIPPAEIHPPNIHQAQLSKRLGGATVAR